MGQNRRQKLFTKSSQTETSLAPSAYAVAQVLQLDERTEVQHGLTETRFMFILLRKSR